MDVEMSPAPAGSELGFINDAEMLASDDEYVAGRDDGNDAIADDWVGVPMEEDAEAGDADYVIADDGHVADATDLLPMDAETAPVTMAETLEAEPELDVDGPVAASSEPPSVEADVGEVVVPVPGPHGDAPPLAAVSEPLLPEADTFEPEASSEAKAIDPSAVPTPPASVPGSPAVEPVLASSSVDDAPQPVVRRDLLDHLPVADVPAEVGGLRQPTAPAIRISFRGQEEFNLFRDPGAPSAAGLVEYTRESSKIYYNVLTGLFIRLRDIFSPIDKEVDPSELTLEIKELDIKINEDNIYAAQAELEDLHRLFRAYHDDSPFVVHIGLRVRFVLRLNQLVEYALKPPEGDETHGAPATTGAADSATQSDEEDTTLAASARPDGVEDDGVVDETGHDADDVADIATEGEDGDVREDDADEQVGYDGDPRLISTASTAELATDHIDTRTIADMLGEGSADLGDLDETDPIDSTAYELEAIDAALDPDADAPVSTEQPSNGRASSSPHSEASSTTLARPDDDAAELDDAADPSALSDVPEPVGTVASSAADVAAALHPVKSSGCPTTSPKRSRDDAVDESDPQSKRPRSS